MESSSIAFLQTNRHHRETVDRGFVRGFFVDRALEIMVSEFRPSYGGVEPHNWDQVSRLIIDLYHDWDLWQSKNNY